MYWKVFYPDEMVQCTIKFLNLWGWALDRFRAVSVQLTDSVARACDSTRLRKMRMIIRWYVCSEWSGKLEISWSAIKALLVNSIRLVRERYSTGTSKSSRYAAIALGATVGFAKLDVASPNAAKVWFKYSRSTSAGTSADAYLRIRETLTAQIGKLPKLSRLKRLDKYRLRLKACRRWWMGAISDIDGHDDSNEPS